ncbi:MAG: D-xylose transport system substrate-binding protein [Pseudonocardiales bacterium]|nr:D-xylose transport system substrate-binding protein [Pseudonocardiales bacterium]
MSSRAGGVGLVVGLALVLSGCSGPAAPDRPKVGVILPTSDTAPHWEDADAQVLERVLRTEGLEPTVENVAGDAAPLIAMANQMINDGSKVLVIATPDDAVEAAVVAEVKKRGVPTIDYDLRGTSSPADYALTLDYRKIGELQGRGLIRGVRGTPAAKIVELEQGPTDSAAAELAEGQRNILQPRYDKGSYNLAGSERLPSGAEAAGAGDPAAGNPAATAAFTRLLAAAGGSVDGVVAANDQVAAAAIAVLRAKQLTGKVTVTGFGASPDALKSILRGEQFMTVYAPVESQAGATAKLAAALAGGDRPAADRLTLGAPAKAGAARAVAVAPASVTLDTIKQVFDSGAVSSDDVCADDLALRCNQLSIS